MTEFDPTKLLEAPQIWIAVVPALATCVWRLLRTISRQGEKIKQLGRDGANRDGRLDALVAAQETMRAQLGEMKVVDALQDERIMRAQKDIDAAHQALRAAAKCTKGGAA